MVCVICLCSWLDHSICSAAVNAETRQQVAIKKIGNAFDNIIDAKRTLREIKLLRHMDHENVSLVLLMFSFSESELPSMMIELMQYLFLFAKLNLCSTTADYWHKGYH